MTRVAHWQSALDAFLRAHRADKFRYGSWDCCLFVCDAVRVITGVDLAQDFRGRYRSRTEALTAIREATGKHSLKAVVLLVTAAHQMAPVPALLAQRGDVALIRRGRRDFSLGIVALNGSDVITVSPQGLLAIPLSLAAAAWRV